MEPACSHHELLPSYGATSARPAVPVCDEDEEMVEVTVDPEEEEAAHRRARAVAPSARLGPERELPTKISAQGTPRITLEPLAAGAEAVIVGGYSVQNWSAQTSSLCRRLTVAPGMCDWWEPGSRRGGPSRWMCKTSSRVQIVLPAWTMAFLPDCAGNFTHHL